MTLDSNGRPEVTAAELLKAYQESDQLRKERDEALHEAEDQRAWAGRLVDQIEEQKRLVEKYQERVRDQVEVIERLRAQNSRLVALCDSFRDQLKVAREESYKLQADYEARGKVIKKLRKRLHKLKKKLKH